MSKLTDENEEKDLVVKKPKTVKKAKISTAKETNGEKSAKKINKKTTKTENKTEVKKEEKVEKKKKVKKSKTEKDEANKSVQNNVIENIKSFITKIIQMQEKVKKDEEEEKEFKKLEKKQEKKKERPKYLLEYYDLPFRYNETVVKILAQTPKRLFVYWDVSDKDKQTYLNAFGESFFEDTYPVLLVHNEDKNYTREVIINDFANSWYLDILDPRDEYTIQLGRKFKEYVKPVLNPEIEETNIELQNDYLFIAQSNKLEMPNDHILFEKFEPYVKYRNVKTQKEEIKNVTNTIYKKELKELYKKLYKDNEEFNFEDERYDFLNPSSMGTSNNVAFK